MNTFFDVVVGVGLLGGAGVLVAVADLSEPTGAGVVVTIVGSPGSIGSIMVLVVGVDMIAGIEYVGSGIGLVASASCILCCRAALARSFALMAPLEPK